MNGPKGVGGWLLVLCISLTIWEPASLALLESSRIAGVAARGPGAVGLIALRLAIGGLGIAAGIALWSRQGHAVVLARVALIVFAAETVFRIGSGSGPQVAQPGTRLPLIALVVAYTAAWLAYLRVSRRVRQTY